MSEEHEIVQLVYDSKEDMEKADDLIFQYLPFIKSETAKFLNRAPEEGRDDELSIAMLAFHEAIRGYDKEKGAFLSYAAMLIRSRLIDYWRSNKKHEDVISIDTPVHDDNDDTLKDTLTDGSDHSEEYVAREATKAEIEELSQQMAEFGVSLTDVAENSPKQERTLKACQDAVEVVKQDSSLMDDFLRTKKLPLKAMTEGSGSSRKTLERHRNYLVAMLIIYSNGYEIIRGHISQVMKGGTA